MHKLPILLFVILFTLISCEQKDKDSYDLIISHASVINIETGEIKENMLILISNDTIIKVEEGGDPNKYDSRESFDAKGKYIIPGLWDMHVHFRGGDTLIEENKNLLPIFLAYGITTVRDAGGDITPAVLDWKVKIKNGELEGPSIFTPGPKLDGPDPAWPGSIAVDNDKEVEAALDSLEELGADYVKIYDGSLSKESFYSIIKKTEIRGLKTTGHMPLSADFLEAVDLGLDGAEHMYYPLKACSPIADSLTNLNLGYGMIEQIIDTYDPDLAREVFSTMAEKRVFITPTLYIQTTLSTILDVDHTRDTLLPLIGDGIQETYRGRIEGAKRAKESGSKMRQKMEEISAKMIVPMHRAGVKILAGSDCGAFNSYVYPGESLHGELRSMVSAGLTPQQALQTSIINGPAFFDLADYYGEVAPGKVADLVILENNPLDNIDHLMGMIAVVKASKVYNREKLMGNLQNLK